MKNIFTALLLCPIAFSFLSGCSEQVKEPAVAGSFYPADKKILSDSVDAFLSRAQNNPIDGNLIALITPHAGHRYSGAVAAYTYKHLKKRKIKTVILIGPSHYSSFRGVSVYTKGRMKTPLGKIKIDHKIAGTLINKEADITFFPDAFEKEHSLEVQFPFLQRALRNFKIVPILISMPTRQSFNSLTTRLIEIMRENEHVMIIASTDLSHYHDYEAARTKDNKVIDAVERMSIEDLQSLLSSREGEMCGGYPVLYTMGVARGLGATNGVLYKYANSGDVTGDRSRVVGYAAMGLYKSPIKESSKKELLNMAKETIIRYVEKGNIPEVHVTDKRLKVNGATFVTVNRRGQLRGCIGNIQPIMPLYQSVISNAVSACSKDRRFPPMKKEELEDMEVEVTILSPLEFLRDVEEIEIGKHGLYIVQDNRTGILLPQVPVQFGWDRETFLKQVSLKAGLPQDAWKSASLYSFTAEIIR